MTEPNKINRRTLAKALSRAANASVAEVLRSSPSAENCSRRIGVTGPPGAGKSSLIAALARQRLQSDGDLAILAIDPTSPAAGGAILGDRIRMEDLAQNPRVYIRSLASRQSHDGLADNLPDLLDIVESSGFAELIIETVGVGQVEYAVRRVVDTIVLVVMPGAGDQIQAMKSGILEMADIIAVNKADQPGAPQLVAELNSVVKLRPMGPRSWATPILETSIRNPQSIDVLGAAIDRHQMWLRDDAGATNVAHGRKAHHVGSLVTRRVSEILAGLPAEALNQPVSLLYDTVVAHLVEARHSSSR
jgi:LAO/AO transport system kinase